MSVETLRFLHASELRLGAPLFGVADLHPTLQDILIDGRYRAAERIFDAALAEQVDFVVLAGGVCPAADPRGMWFFEGQCARLAERGIVVYWAEEPNAVAWADYAALPVNVYRTDASIGHVYEHNRSGRVAARVITGNPVRRGLWKNDGAPTISLLPEGIEGLPLAPVEVDYWALGGRTAAGEVSAASGIAHYSGTPQGHSPSEPGPRGCLLVETAPGAQLSTRFIATDSVRWHNERVDLDDATSWQPLLSGLHSRLETLQSSNGHEAGLVCWTISGHGAVWQQLLRDDVCERLLNDLRKRGMAGPRPAWSLLIDVAPDAAQFAAWSVEESSFGAVAHAVSHAPIGGVRSPRDQGPHFAQRVRQRALRHAARLLPERRTEELSAP